jgi:putative glutamine amidotransferase
MQIPLIGITGRIEPPSSPDASRVCLAETYVRAIERAGGTPVIIGPHGETDAVRAAFERLDGLVLSGGGDISPQWYGEAAGDLLWRVDERRDRAELSMARWALEELLPLLAICRGIQVLNVAAGGTLFQDVSTQVPGALTHPSLGSHPTATVAHTVDVVAHSQLATIFGAGQLGVNSSHHQATKRVGEGLIATAVAPDGVIEGLECPTAPFCVGVQWHPEAMVERHPRQRELFEAMVTAARGPRT